MKTNRPMSSTNPVWRGSRRAVISSLSPAQNARTQAWLKPRLTTIQQSRIKVIKGYTSLIKAKQASKKNTPSSLDIKVTRLLIAQLSNFNS
jgi:hypothetical protein